MRLNDPRMWWVLSKVRAYLIDRRLTMPPRSILDGLLHRAVREMGESSSAEMMAAAVTAWAVQRRGEFADKAVILEDLKKWHNPERAKILANMDYDLFLRTCYWLSLSSYMVVSAGGCEMCLETIEGLQDISTIEVHHLNYADRGREIGNLTCLRVLCGSCHALTHDKAPRGKTVTIKQGIAAALLRMGIAGDKRLDY